MRLALLCCLLFDFLVVILEQIMELKTLVPIPRVEAIRNFLLARATRPAGMLCPLAFCHLLALCPLYMLMKRRELCRFSESWLLATLFQRPDSG